MENDKKNFDSIQELNSLSLNRLFVLQKVELKALEHYIINILKYKNDEFNINDVFNSLENILTINSVINNKTKKYKI